MPDVLAPVFSGITSATALSQDVVLLAWTAATDDTSLTANLVYDVSFATTALACTGVNFLTQLTTKKGATSIAIGQLTPLTQYFFCVRARDEAGNEDTNDVTANAITTATPTAADVTAPVIGAFSPPSGTPIGTSQVIEFNVTDNLSAFRRIFVTCTFGNTGIVEVIYDGNNFVGRYTSFSTKANIDSGHHFGVLRLGGWTGPPLINVYAIDSAGNEGTG